MNLAVSRLMLLDCYDIKINLTDRDPENPTRWREGTIESQLHDKPPHALVQMVESEQAREDRLRYKTAIEAVEGLILAHACAGIGVDAHAYIEGIETAVDAIFSSFP